jgi:hypothetical protein
MLNHRQSLCPSKTALLFFTFCISTTIHTNPVVASPLVFNGQNAALFPGANPNDTAALMNSVAKPTPQTKAPTALDQNRIIIQGLESQITNRIYTQIFNNANVSGIFTLPGGGSISYNRPGDGNVHITVINSDGTTSVIVVPDI